MAGDLSSAPKWMKVTFGILAGLFTLGVVLYVTGAWNYFIEMFEGSGDSSIWMNVVMIGLVIGAVVVAVVSGKKGGSSGEKDK